MKKKKNGKGKRNLKKGSAGRESSMGNICCSTGWIRQKIFKQKRPGKKRTPIGRGAEPVNLQVINTAGAQGVKEASGEGRRTLEKFKKKRKGTLERKKKRLTGETKDLKKQQRIKKVVV